MANLVPIPGGTSQDQAMAVISKNFAELAAESNTKIYNDASGIPSISIGTQPDRSTRIRVAKPGVNVITATDDQLIFNSAQNVFKIAKTGTAVITRPTATNDFGATNTVTHSLGFIPFVFAYVTPPAGYSGVLKNSPTPFFDYILYDSLNPANIGGWHINGLADIVQVTDTVITFRLAFVAGFAGQVGDWTFKYYLLQETAT